MCRIMRFAMTTADDKKARLAAQLRANLHRRKAQARGMAYAAPGVPDDAPDPFLSPLSSPADQPDR